MKISIQKMINQINEQANKICVRFAGIYTFTIAVVVEIY